MGQAPPRKAQARIVVTFWQRDAGHTALVDIRLYLLFYETTDHALAALCKIGTVPDRNEGQTTKSFFNRNRRAHGRFDTQSSTPLPATFFAAKNGKKGRPSRISVGRYMPGPMGCAVCSKIHGLIGPFFTHSEIDHDIIRFLQSASCFKVANDRLSGRRDYGDRELPFATELVRRDSANVSFLKEYSPRDERDRPAIDWLVSVLTANVQPGRVPNVSWDVETQHLIWSSSGSE